MLFGMFARTHTQARNVSTRDDLLDVPISRFLSVASHLRISRFGELDMSRTQPGWAKSQDILGRHPRRGKPYFMPEIFETYLCMCGCENFPEYSITFLADLSSSFPSTLPSFALFSFSFFFYPPTSLFSQLLTAAAFVRSRRFLSELIAKIWAITINDNQPACDIHNSYDNSGVHRYNNQTALFLSPRVHPHPLGLLSHSNDPPVSLPLLDIDTRCNGCVLIANLSHRTLTC